MYSAPLAYDLSAETLSTQSDLVNYHRITTKYTYRARNLDKDCRFVLCLFCSVVSEIKGNDKQSDILRVGHH